MKLSQPSWTVCCQCCCLILVLLAQDVAHSQEPAPHPLKEFGFGATEDDVRRCLKLFVPDKERQAKIGKLIKELSDPKFAVRENANVELARLPILPRADLRKAAEAGDAETKARIEQILEHRSDEYSDRLLHAALRQVAQLEQKGFAPEILAAIGKTERESFLALLSKALVATATEKDGELFEKILAHERPDLRGAAIKVLVELQGEKSAESIKKLLDDKDDRVALDAARALGNMGNRASLATLVRLLDAQKVGVRLGAAEALRWLSGKKFEFRSTDSSEKRKTAIAAWKKWVEGDGKTAKLTFPIEAKGEIALFNGIDLTGWKVFMGEGVLPDVDAAKIWKVEKGILKLKAHRATAVLGGYLRTEKKYANYKLSLEYRWPEGSSGGDSGIHLCHTGPDARTPSCLEVQTYQGQAGDFYRIGDFNVEPGGELRIGTGTRKGGTSEKPAGKWNKVDVKVFDGKVTVHINGVLQNEATGCPKEPGYIGFRMEGHSFDLNNVVLEPLGD